MKKVLLLLAVALVGLTSCSKDSMETVDIAETST